LMSIFDFQLVKHNNNTRRLCPFNSRRHSSCI
jgi:hypothetical protein